MFSTLDNRTENYSTQVNTPGNTSGKVCNMIPSINLVNLELIQPDPKNQSTQDCGGGGRPLHSELDSNVLNMNDKRKYHRHHIILIPFIHLLLSIVGQTMRSALSSQRGGFGGNSSKHYKQLGSPKRKRASQKLPAVPIKTGAGILLSSKADSQNAIL